MLGSAYSVITKDSGYSVRDVLIVIFQVVSKSKSLGVETVAQTLVMTIHYWGDSTSNR